MKDKFRLSLLSFIFLSITGCNSVIQTVLPTENFATTDLPTQAATQSLQDILETQPIETSTTTPTKQPTTTPITTDMGHLPFPSSFYIKNIVGHVQTYELGCEASAATDWANYFGVFFYEYTFQTSLPRSDNPNFGFVGEVTTDGWGQIPPDAYGIHAGPVADLLVQFGLPARAVYSYSLEEVKQKISESKPVIAWVIGNMEYSQSVEYIDTGGRAATVAPYEHVVILTGYNETSIRYMNNGRFYEVPTDVFLTSWGVLGNMAIIYD